MKTLRISTHQHELDVPLIHDFLSNQSYWAQGIPLATVETSLKHSLCFGGFIDDQQVAFARVISDYATFANLVDVFVLPAYRERGYSKLLLQAVMQHPQLQGLRRFTLVTADAHQLYAKLGFTPLRRAEFFMERHKPDIYADRSA